MLRLMLPNTSSDIIAIIFGQSYEGGKLASVSVVSAIVGTKHECVRYSKYSTFRRPLFSGIGCSKFKLKLEPELWPIIISIHQTECECHRAFKSAFLNTVSLSIADSFILR